MKYVFHFLSFFVTFTIFAVPAFASDNEIVQIKEGLSFVDLDDDKNDEIIVKAVRQNAGEQGTVVISYYRTNRKGQMLVIPFHFEKSDRPFNDADEALIGNHCMSQTTAILKEDLVGNKWGTYLVRAEKQLLKNFKDASTIRFDVFRLTKNETQEPGLPMYYFKNIHSKLANKAYCDVREALAAEADLLLK